MNVLIIDDHEMILMVLSNMVLELLPNARVFKCKTKEDAKKFFLDINKIDFAICDLQLTNGCSTEIPELFARNNIPVMIYSSHTNRSIINEIIDLGVKVFVSKTASLVEARKGLNAVIDNTTYFCSLVTKTMECSESSKPAFKLVLTKSQKLVLDILSQGFNREECARRLNLKITTVNNHIAHARELNDCYNLEELLRRYRIWDYD